MFIYLVCYYVLRIILSSTLGNSRATHVVGAPLQWHVHVLKSQVLLHDAPVWLVFDFAVAAYSASPVPRPFSNVARLRRPLLTRLREARLPGTGGVHVGGHRGGCREEAQVPQGAAGSRHDMTWHSPPCPNKKTDQRGRSSVRFFFFF